MDMADIISLVSHTQTQGSTGVWTSTETLHEVFAQVDSITQSEFFEAGRNGLNPEYRFTIFAYDYADEVEVEYDGKRYAVYRTYRAKNDKLELYVQRKGGTNKAVVTSG